MLSIGDTGPTFHIIFPSSTFAPFYCCKGMYTMSLSQIFLITAAALNICAEGVMRPVRETNNRVIDHTHSRPKTDMTSTNSSNINIVFSDLDGTLIHYPRNIDKYTKREIAKDICLLPASSTGMVGVISAKSLQLIREIRQTGTLFVLVSGMRSSTLLKRLPYLPKADAYCCEDGGRIFYPTQLQPLESFGVNPNQFLGATAEDMHPFSLVEDMEWRKRMEQDSAAGTDGYFGNELNPLHGKSGKEIPISERRGCLWDFSSSLLEKGFTIDSVGYCTCFRVNKKQQSDSSLFDTLMHGHIDIPAGLASSTNLGCIDFYPGLSGKKNW